MPSTQAPILRRHYQRTSVLPLFRDTFRREIGAGITTVWGRHPKAGNLSLLSVEFDGEIHTATTAEAYLSERDEVDLAVESQIGEELYVHLSERFDGLAARGSEIGVDRAHEVIRGCLMCGLESTNKRRYHEALSDPDAPKLYEGCHVNSNHVEPGMSVAWQDRIGKYRNVRFVEGSGMIGDLHYNPHYRHIQQLLHFAEHMPDAIGNSHRVNAVGSKAKDGVFDVRKIMAVFSTDIVADGGTTKSMYEGDRMTLSTHSVHPKPEIQETDEMAELKDMAVRAIIEARPDVVEAIREAQKAEKEYVALVAERDALKKERDDMKAKLDEHDKIAARAKKIAEIKERAKKELGEGSEKYVSDLWLESLADQPAEKVAEHIAERKTLALGEKASPVKSKSKTVQDQRGAETGSHQSGGAITSAKDFAEAARAGR